MKKAPRFVHLRMHSEFSITDGIARLKDAARLAQENQMPALALTDLNNVFGLLKFYEFARAVGVKPILGADVYLKREGKFFRSLLLVKNNQGYQALCGLLSRAYMENTLSPAVDVAWLNVQNCAGLILCSGGVFGEIGEDLLQKKYALAVEKAEFWAELFPNSFYLEIQRFGQKNEDFLVYETRRLAENLNLPLLATHPIQFLKKEDFLAHEVRVCIAEGEVLSTKKEKKFTKEQYFKSEEEMALLFADVPEALENSVEIAKRCNLDLRLGEHFLPDFPTLQGLSVADLLIQKAQEGLKKRLIQLYPDESTREAKRSVYEERLAFECATIVQMGFQGYFLIVADFINWGKENHVPVGPGRGSGAGSLVAFSLGITDLDPLAYALLFERFLNPERVSMPDFDVDFCQDNRFRVIDYVRQRYGKEAVAQIVTFGTMASRAVIRDVGRVLGMSYSLCDRISKLIPVEANHAVSLKEALEKEPQLAELMNDSRDGEAVKNLFDLAMALEDLTRNTGMHAGGVLIAPSKISDFCPMYLSSSTDAVPVAQFDKDDVEKIGLVKFDFLGLRNLTIIDWALAYIKEQTGESLDLSLLPLDDPATYELLRQANTTAVFQVESDGMKQLLKKILPDRFEDIIAILALYRPGPLNSGMVDDFINRKKGQQKIDFFHPDLKTILEPTYGVIVYQEQVMQISQVIGGYTLGGADMLRRAMGKKKPEEMAKHRQTIMEGALKKGYDQDLAARLFDLMAKFAEYGFNKSHSAAYAVLTYQTAWLKTHYPAAFMAASLSSEMDKTETVKVFFEDSLKNKLHILPPSVNDSLYRFVPVDEKTIRYGLGALKGVGENAVNALVKAREKGGKFLDLFDFCKRCDKQLVNRRALESFISSGAMDDFKMPRAQLLANVDLALQYAEQSQKNAMQGSLFGGSENAHFNIPDYLPAPPEDAQKKLALEKEALGFYFSGHPFRLYRKELSPVLAFSLNQLSPQKESVWLAGIVSSIRSKMGKNGKTYFVQLDDGSGELELLFFAEKFNEIKDWVKEDKLLLVKTKLEKDPQERWNARVELCLDLAHFRERFLSGIVLHLEYQNKISPADLKKIITPYLGGQCALIVNYKTPNAACRLLLGEHFRVKPTPALLLELKQKLPKIELFYQDFPR